MNKIYNLIWSRALRCLVVVAERVTDGRGKGGRRVVRTVALGAFGIPVIALAQGPLPTGGQTVSGTGAIATNGNAMTITQSSGRLITNWNSFSIGAGNSVTFKQPGASSVALNRVTGQDPSQILGSLTSNGQVFLVNPNGIVFGNGARVRTGAFVASTLGISDQDFLSGHYRFTNGAGAGSSIVNQGTLSGDVVALISPSVVNEGTITGSPGGGVALAAGSDVLLDFDGDGLLSVQVNASTMQTLAENKGLIATDGGTALLTAKGASDALKGVVNNTGTIEAHTIANQGGRILLLADMDHGETQVDGKLDASAPGSGDGGYIETSAHKVSVADSAQITTQASNGKTGTWLIDPNDFTIAASGGDMTGAALSNQLASSNVEVQSGTAATAGNGDIFVNDVVTWATNKLTLHAVRNIVVDSTMNGSGTAGLALEYGQGAVAAGNSATYTINAPVNLAATGSFSTKMGSDGNTVNYTIVTSLGNATSTNDGTLQGIGGALSGNYVLGADIDASATSGWNAGAGFTPIGSSSSPFTGVFDGLGHTIDTLTISQPSSSGPIGMFGLAGSSATITNVRLTNAAISGVSDVGALAGFNEGTVSQSYVTGSVSGHGDVGGLIGRNDNGTVSNAHAAASVNGADNVGGLIGMDSGIVTACYATGAVTATGSEAGGLLGTSGGTVSNSYATGAVSAPNFVGGLIGVVGGGVVQGTHATGTVNGTADVGGLIGSIGLESTVTVQGSYATGSVTGNTAVGGLVGLVNSGATTLETSYASGNVSGASSVGGLVGENDSVIKNVYATGSVTGGDNTGGLVGLNVGSVSFAYASGAVTGTAGSSAGLVGGSSVTLAPPPPDDGGSAADSAPPPPPTSNTLTGTVASSVWNTETTGQSSGCAGVSCGATGSTASQMKDPFVFIDAGWDFSSTWGKSQVGNNNGNMVLRSLDSTVYSDYVRPESATRVYGSSGPALTSVVLDGAGTSNVSVSVGSGIGLHTSVGTYAYSAGNTIAITDAAGRSVYLDYGSGALTITPATISGITGIAASNKTYDGTTTVALNTASAAFSGLVSGDTLTVATANGAFSDKNAGAGKTVTISGLSLGGADAGNYTLANTSASATADIAKAAIAAITGITASDKTYDGTTAATLNLGGAHFTGMIAGDHLAVATATGAFADSRVGAAKTVNITGLSLGGADALNYALANDTAVAVASIVNVVTPTPPTGSKSTTPTTPTGSTGSTTPTGSTSTTSSSHSVTSATPGPTPLPPLMPGQTASAEGGRPGSDVPLTAAPSELIDVSGIMPAPGSASAADISLRAAGCSASNAQGGVSSCSR